MDPKGVSQTSQESFLNHHRPDSKTSSSIYVTILIRFSRNRTNKKIYIHNLYWVGQKVLFSFYKWYIKHERTFWQTWKEIKVDVSSSAVYRGIKQWYPSNRSASEACILVTKYHSLLKGIKTPWRKGWFQEEKYTMCLKYLFVPEHNKVLKNKRNISQGHRKNRWEITLKGLLVWNDLV